MRLGPPPFPVFAFAALLAALGGGCSKSEIEVRRIPKQDWESAARPDGEGAANLGGRIDWTPPPGWESLPPTALLKGRYRWPGTASRPPLLIEISSFPGAAGGLLVHVNRWREELGHETPIDEEGLDRLMSARPIDGRVAAVVDVRNEAADPPLRLVATAIRHAGQSWFFKISGAAPEVERKLPDYERLLESLRFIERIDGGSAADAEPLSQELVFEAPNSWIPQENSPVRYASYRIPSEDGPEGDFSVTYVKAEDYAGLRANVNRWRRQLDLEPLSRSEIEGRASQLVSREHVFTLVDIVRTGPTAGEAQSRGDRRLLAAVLERGSRVWFFKLEGPDDLLREHVGAFESLLESVAFAPAESGASPARETSQ